ncbi:polysaccharide deacetylase family protein [Lignipirellula cremea]|uniref:Polysaccharide deacetylase n=1 Tax=Lignipirellula cremea TaxID=2528010 RepID=A0A518E582_9BACT|nr:polysaccharide deacetylase family protein [Lignipirellula cremea]QDU99240.1 Polysaccharide deacetylase [Lignipirellula cremea]
MASAALSIGKRSLLGAYYYGSQPLRALWNAWDRQRGMAPISILFYHRVADDCPNDWTISQADFAGHIAWLQRHFDLVSLEEAQARIRSGENRRPAVSITFDDGYADNCAFALPLLVKERIPCTYFVTLGNVEHRHPFPHDVARGEPLEPNTVEQLRSIAASGIEVGAHTRTHPDLGAIDDESVLLDEVVTSTRQLAALIRRPVRYFAFPFGLPRNLNRRVFALAQEQGLLGVCSAYGGYNFPGDDPYHLQRIHGDPDLLRLKNWLTIDPRKRGVPRYEYATATGSLAPSPLISQRYAAEPQDL